MEALYKLAIVQLVATYSIEKSEDREVPSSIQKLIGMLTLKGCVSVKKESWMENFSLTSAFREAALLIHKDLVPQVRDLSNRICNELYSRVMFEVNDYVDRTLEFCQIFRIPVGSDHRRRMEHVFFLLALQGKLSAAFKQSVNVLFCDHMGVERPEIDVSLPLSSLFPRSVVTHFNRMKKTPRSRLSYLKTRNLTCAWSILQGLKKSLLPVRPSKMASQLVGHATALSRVEEFRHSVDHAEDVVMKVCKAFRIDNLSKEAPLLRTIGTKATVGSSYAKKGNLGHLWRTTIETENDTSVSSYWAECDKFVGFSTKNGVPQEVRGFVISDKDLIDDFRDLKESDYDFRKVESEAIPAMILEPMKVRIITKPTETQFIPLQDLQKKISRKLSKHQSGVFRLTGETINDEMIGEFVKKSKWLPGDLWISGDYTAATDNLHPLVPRMFVERIWGHHFFSHPELWERIRSSLFETHIDYLGCPLPREDVWRDSMIKIGYPKKKLDQIWRETYGIIDEVIQVSGQLMGNVLSFPLLCLTNLCAFWCAYEEYLGKSVNFEDLPPVLINGDDILFKANPTFYRVWLSVVTRFGLKPSIGKNFASDSFLTINSCLYRVDSELVVDNDNVLFYNTNVKKVPYVNFGLICNRRKNDCSKDYSIKRVSHVLNTDSSLPEVVDRLVAAPKILETLLDGFDAVGNGDALCQEMLSLHYKHSSYFREKFPKLPWKRLYRTQESRRWLKADQTIYYPTWNIKTRSGSTVNGYAISSVPTTQIETIVSEKGRTAYELEQEYLNQAFRSIVPPNLIGVATQVNMRSLQKLQESLLDERDIIIEYYRSIKKLIRLDRASRDPLFQGWRVPQISMVGLHKDPQGRWEDVTTRPLFRRVDSDDLIVPRLTDQQEETLKALTDAGLIA